MISTRNLYLLAEMFIQGIYLSLSSCRVLWLSPLSFVRMLSLIHLLIVLLLPFVPRGSFILSLLLLPLLIYITRRPLLIPSIHPLLNLESPPLPNILLSGWMNLSLSHPNPLLQNDALILCFLMSLALTSPSPSVYSSIPELSFNKPPKILPGSMPWNWKLLSRR